MKTPRACSIGIHLLLTSQISYSLVLLSANIDDVRQLAKQFVSEPLAEKIAKFLAKATVIKTVDISEENLRNNPGDKLPEDGWNRAGERQLSHRSDGIKKEANDDNGVSIKRGRMVLSRNRDDMQRDLSLDRPSSMQTKKNFVYDYALKQDATKEPNFEWKKAANFDFFATSNQRHLFDNSNIYAHVPDVARVPNLIKSTNDGVYEETKKLAKTKASNEFKETRKPAKKKIYLDIIKETGKPAKIEKHSEEFKQTRKPVKVNTHLKIIKETSKPAKLEPYSNEFKETRKPVKEETYLNIIKESREPIELEKQWDVPKKLRKTTAAKTRPPIKKQPKIQSDDERNKNNIESDESSETDRVSQSNQKVHGFTRFPDYYETAETTKDTLNKQPSDRSIYTKDGVLATSGPVELLKASVKLVYSSDENSLNYDNRNYFKEYDSDAGTKIDFRRHLEADHKESLKSGELETVKTRYTTPNAPEETNEVDTAKEDETAVKEEATHRTTDPEERPRTAFLYGGARVYNNLEHKQAGDIARGK